MLWRWMLIGSVFVLIVYNFSVLWCYQTGQFYEPPTFKETFPPTFAGEKQNKDCNVVEEVGQKTTLSLTIYLSLAQIHLCTIFRNEANASSFLFLLIRNEVNSKYLSLKDKKKMYLAMFIIRWWWKKEKSMKKLDQKLVIEKKREKLLL